MIELRVFGSADLRSADGRTLHTVLAQPKRLAVLVYLALASPRGFHRRDTLLSLFWPEMDQARARSALRKSVHHLRQALGADLIAGRGDDELGIADGFLRCDAVAFEQALEQKAPAEALDLYRGDLLDGLYLSEVPEFERWLERERARFRRRAAEAAWLLSAQEELRNGAAAVEAARRAVALDQDDEVAVRRLLALLDRVGDRVGAVRTFQEHKKRLEEDFELAPSAETVALIDSILARSRQSVSAPARLSEPPRASLAATAPRPAAVPQTDRPRPRAPPADLRAGGDQDEEQEGESAANERMMVTSRAMRVVRPSDETPRLIGRPIPDDSGRESIELPTVGPSPTPSAATAPVSSPGIQLPRAGARWLVGGVAAAGLLLASALLFSPGDSRLASAMPAIAVGSIHDFTGEDESRLAQSLPNMLTTSLARASGMQVVSTGRLYGILGSLEEDAAETQRTIEAARRAGARHLVEGAVYRRSERLLQLDVRRVDLRTGAVEAAYSVEGEDPFSLVEDVTARLLSGFGAAAPSVRLSDVTTTSLVAHRFYEEGLRSYYRGDEQGSRQLFAMALAEDSTFAMAAYYAGRAHTADWVQRQSYLRRAVALSGRATERERLLIRGTWAHELDEPARLAIAETLAVRYPLEPDGHYLLGNALLWDGDFLGALPHLRRAVAMDSINLRAERPRCVACDAMLAIIAAYNLADSLPASERAARQWLRAHPEATGAWNALADALENLGRFTEAEAAHRKLATLQPGHDVSLRLALNAIRAGRFDEADRRLLGRIQTGNSAEEYGGRWYLAISLRHQGRTAEALEVIRRLRAGSSMPSAMVVAMHEAQMLVEIGRAREAAALFDSNRRVFARHDTTPGKYARGQVWTLTHTAAARAAAGDTGSLQELADSMQILGLRSAYGRDRRLHHHVRGLLHAARGHHDDAVRAFRRAIFSPNGGYTRTNLELARSLLHVGRPREAVAVLQSALRGSLEASNLYITHTEVHELLGMAFERARAPDSAAAHYRRVLAAWEHADLVFHARRESVRARLAALEPLLAAR